MAISGVITRMVLPTAATVARWLAKTRQTPVRGPGAQRGRERIRSHPLGTSHRRVRG